MAGFFGLFDFTKEGKGVTKDENQKYRFFVFFDVYFRKFWKLIELNLLFSISYIIPLLLIYISGLFLPDKQSLASAVVLIVIGALSIIPIGSALTGFFYVLRNFSREDHAFVYSDFIKTVKSNWKMGSLIFLIDVLLTIAIYVGFNTYSAMPGIFGTIGKSVIMFTGIVLTFMNYYLYTMQVTFKLSFKKLYKNAFLFSFLGLFKNIMITIILSLLIYAIYITRPLSFVFVLIFLISLCGFIISFVTYPTIRKFMIDPIVKSDNVESKDLEKKQEIPAFDDNQRIK